MIRRAEILPLVICATAAAGATYACYLAAGPTLGLFFGGFIVASIVAPCAVVGIKPSPPRSPGVPGEGASGTRLIFQLIAMVIVSISIAAVWLIAICKTPDTLNEWIQLSLALLFYSGAIAGIATMLNRIKTPQPIAAGIAILIGLAWLSWPIWLGQSLSTLPPERLAHIVSKASPGLARIIMAIDAPRVVNWLVVPHPLLTANGVLINESPWTEKPLAYQWTNLNQDIPAQMPASALPCILLHGCIAVVLALRWPKSRQAK